MCHPVTPDFQYICHFQHVVPFGPVILYLLIKVYVMDEGAYVHVTLYMTRVC